MIKGVWAGACVVLVCTSGGVVSAQTAPVPVAFVLEVKGELQVRRQGGANYGAVVEGTEIILGDLLRTGIGNAARIRCPNGTIASLGEERRVGVQGLCPNFPRANDPRGVEEILELFRGDFAFSSQVLMVDGEVRVPFEFGTDGAAAIDAVTTAGGGEVALEMGDGERLVIEIGVLADRELAVLERVQEIDTEDLGDVGRGLAIAALYREYDLKFEAIAVLEELVQEGTDAVAVYGMLGDLYVRFGLIAEGEAKLQRALELADEAAALDVAVRARYGLAMVAAGQGEVEVAITELECVRDWYETLGREEIAKDFTELLEYLIQTI